MREQLIALLGDIRPDVSFESEKKLIDSSILDSFDLISIIEVIEDKFGVTVDVDNLEPENFNSVDSMVELIHKLQNQ